MTTAKYLAIIAIVATLASCKKNADKTPSTIIGKWELESSNSAWIGQKTYPPGNGNTLEFENNTYVRNTKYNDTAFQTSGVYSIFNGSYCEQASKRTVIKFDNEDLLFDFLWSGAKISMSTPECLQDGGTSTYHKISP